MLDCGHWEDENWRGAMVSRVVWRLETGGNKNSQEKTVSQNQCMYCIYETDLLPTALRGLLHVLGLEESPDADFSFIFLKTELSVVVAVLFLLLFLLPSSFSFSSFPLLLSWQSSLYPRETFNSLCSWEWFSTSDLAIFVSKVLELEAWTTTPCIGRTQDWTQLLNHARQALCVHSSTLTLLGPVSD